MITSEENVIFAWGERKSDYPGNLFANYIYNETNFGWIVDYHTLLKTGHVYDIQINGSEIYIGGTFYLAGRVIVNNIALW